MTIDGYTFFINKCLLRYYILYNTQMFNFSKANKALVVKFGRTRLFHQELKCVLSNTRMAVIHIVLNNVVLHYFDMRVKVLLFIHLFMTKVAFIQPPSTLRNSVRAERFCRIYFKITLHLTHSPHLKHIQARKYGEIYKKWGSHIWKCINCRLQGHVVRG